MKKFVCGLVFGVVCSLALTAFAAEKLNIIQNPYPVFIDGVKEQVEGYNINGSTFLKLRDLERAGLSVVFDSDKKQINIKAPSSTVNSTDPNNKSGYTSIEYTREGKKFIAIKYSDELFISENDLVTLYNIKRSTIYNNIITFIRGNKNVNVPIENNKTVLNVNNNIYYKISFFNYLLGN